MKNYYIIITGVLIHIMSHTLAVTNHIEYSNIVSYLGLTVFGIYFGKILVIRKSAFKPKLHGTYVVKSEGAITLMRSESIRDRFLCVVHLKGNEEPTIGIPTVAYEETHEIDRFINYYNK